ncbi:MAG: ABC transporter ATP-binding protein [Arcobacteraceae bacterium]
MSCSVHLKEISYSNENKSILTQINLHVGHEEKVAIIGANGSGKSTLLKIIAGLVSPTSGSIELFHEPMKSLKAFKAHRHQIGYLPQDVNNHFLCPTVIEDVCFSLRANKISQKEAIHKAEKLLEQLNITHLKNRSVFELSGGEQKTAALAGLLVLEPKILLLDEPTNALDEQSQEKIIDLLNGIKKSMIIVSHHKSFIESLSSSMYELKNANLTKIK